MPRKRWKLGVRILAVCPLSCWLSEMRVSSLSTLISIKTNMNKIQWTSMMTGALLACDSASGATFLVSDVTRWIGPAAGPGISQAVLVIDWNDGQTPWAWGYRWDTTQARTGTDLLNAVAGVDPRLTFTGGFISNIAWNADLSGANERFKPGFNSTTNEFWTYSVNNAQQENNFVNGAAPTGAHILPPNGSPYDEGGPGAWVSANTGAAGRPLVDGSWDGWYYATFSTNGPLQPVNAPPPVPEPSSGGLAAVLCAWVVRRRRQAA